LSGNKILVVFAIFFASFSFAQPGEVEVEFKDGQEYWIHVVQEGNTLYGIKRTYNVDIPTIMAHNVGMDEILQIGERIFIPTGRTELEVKKNESATHIVEKGETVYGLTKKYNCTQAELIELNPGIDKGLKVGESLFVPKSKIEISKLDTIQVIEPIKPEIDIVWNDSIVEHEVLKHETLYSISKRYMVPVNDIKKLNDIKRNNIKVGSIVKIKLKKIEKYEVVQKDLIIADTSRLDSSLVLPKLNFGFKKQYNVVIAMPFCLSKNASVMQKNRLVGSNEMYKYTEVSMDFYMGALLAIDSLKKKGLNVVVDVFDTANDTSRVSEFVQTDVFKKADVVFGPFSQKNIKIMANAIKDNVQARIVLPFSSNSLSIQNNEQVYLPISTEVTIVQNLAKVILKKHGKHNVILLNSGKDKDKPLYEKFKTAYSEYSIDLPETRVLKESTIGSGSGRDFATSIDRGDTNIIITLSNDRTLASKVMTTLNKVKNKSGGYDDAYIETYGRSSWEKYKEIKIPYRLKLNLHIPISYHLDYTTPATKQMIQSYRNKFNTDPAKNGVHSFDVVNYFLSTFFLNRKPSQIMNDFDMIQKGAGNGYENNHLKVVYYQDYQQKVSK
jgi:LysM repeat protein